MAYTVLNVGKYAAKNVESYNKDVQATFDMPNGSFIALAGLVSGQNDVYAATPVSDVTTQEVLLVHGPEVIEVDGLRVPLTDVSKFINPANRPVRAVHVKVGDDITLTSEGFSATPTVGKYAVPANGQLTLAPADDLSGNTLVAFQVLEQTTIAVGQNRKTAYRLVCVRSL